MFSLLILDSEDLPVCRNSDCDSRTTEMTSNPDRSFRRGNKYAGAVNQKQFQYRWLMFQ